MNNNIFNNCYSIVMNNQIIILWMTSMVISEIMVASLVCFPIYELSNQQIHRIIVIIKCTFWYPNFYYWFITTISLISDLITDIDSTGL